MKIPDIIKEATRKLRRNMTPAEIVLWEELKWDKIWKKFYRQKPIFVFKENSWLDRYVIADFYSPENKLVIELDGNIHDLKDIYLLDREKEKLLKNRWYKVIRFINNEVISDIDWALEKILRIF